MNIALSMPHGFDLTPMDQLPNGIRSRFVENGNGLRMHVLEAGNEKRARQCVMLLHGFPELASCWHRVIPVLAAAGYHVVAPDQRGFGRTTGGESSYDGHLAQFRPLNLVRDAIGLLFALGRRSAHIVGRDLGATVAAWAALSQPKHFETVALMTSPFAGPPSRFDTDSAKAITESNAILSLNEDLA